MSQELIVGILIALFSGVLGSVGTAWRMNATLKEKQAEATQAVKDAAESSSRDLSDAIHKMRNEFTIQVGRLESKVSELDRHGSSGLEKMQGRLEAEIDQMEKRVEHIDEVGSRSMAEVVASLSARIDAHANQPGHEQTVVNQARLEVKVDRLIKDVEELAQSLRKNGFIVPSEGS